MSRADPELDTLSFRSCSPAHYVANINPVTELLKINPATKYMNLPVVKFGPFKVGGYNWRLELICHRPTHERKGYLSLFLVIDEPCKIGRNEKVLVDYKFFVYNYVFKKFAIFKERGKELRAFTREKKRWGFSKFLSFDDFKNRQWGYVDPNICIIGAELLVSKPIKTKATLTIKNPSSIKNTPTSTAKIQQFSASKSKPQYSEAFYLEERYWKLKVHPQRKKGKEGLSIHLEAQSISPGKLLRVNAIVRVLNTDDTKDKEGLVEGWLRANEYTCDKPLFIPCDLTKGFIQRNELKFQVKILTTVNVRKTDELVER